MPLYTYRCTCGKESREFNTIADRDLSPNCHGPMKRVIEAPQVQAQILGGGTHPGYLCPVSGRYITSRRERRNVMKEHGLAEAENSGSDKDRRAKMLANTNGTGVSN